MKTQICFATVCCAAASGFRTGADASGSTVSGSAKLRHFAVAEPVPETSEYQARAAEFRLFGTRGFEGSR